MSAELLLKICFNVVGGLGIFLLGMKNMSEGMQVIAGDRLRRLIGMVTDNRFVAVLAGMFVTCLVQSSSVTTVMVVGFVNSGFMTLMQAIGVIFGANVGTTITGWILTLKIGKYGLPMLGMAALLFLFSKNDRLRYTGMFFMGVGMIFFGLELMKDGFKPLRGMEEFKAWFTVFQATSYLGVLKCALVGCILTFIVQSSSATLGITMGLAATGVINFATAGALVLGENIGTTITAYLASLGANTEAKRAAYAHMMFNVLGVAWITAIYVHFYLPFIQSLLGVDPNVALAVDGNETPILAGIAMIHTGFNVTNTIVFIPLMGIIARVVTRMAPDKAIKEAHHLRFLDVRMVDSPALGIAQSRKEIGFMAESVNRMLAQLKEVIEKDGDEELERKIFHREDILDNVQKEVMLYLSDMLSGSVPHNVMVQGRCQLRMADELESLSDYIVNVLKMYKKLRNNDLEMSEQGRYELLDLHDKVAGYLQMIAKALMEDNDEVLTKAYTYGDEITHLMKEYRRSHLERLENDEVKPLKSLIYTDMLNAYRRMKDHGLNVAEALAGD